MTHPNLFNPPRTDPRRRPSVPRIGSYEWIGGLQTEAEAVAGV